LLAQLREAQDGPPASTSTTPADSTKPKSTNNSNPRTVQNHSGASSKQLNDLLSSLGKSSAQPEPEPARRQLIEPFGPISALPPASRSSIVHGESSNGNTARSELSFTKALPIISNLLEDDSFKVEVRRMKVDQDTLERRLWAKMEKVKGEHDKTTRTDREMYVLSC